METWQLAALVAMVFLAAYALVVKKFFIENYDWRAFIPLILAVAIVASAYFIYTGAYNEVKQDSYVFAIALGVIFCASTAATFIAMKEGQLGVVVPIFSLNLVLVVIGGAVFFKEPMTSYKLAGALLGLASIFLLTFEPK
ncbi:MAG: EamA family transporter [Candidatus Micrarchaeota archaeon]